MFSNIAKNKLPIQNHFTIRIQHRSRHPRVRDAHVVAVPYLLPNNNWPKEPCGTENVSIVLNAIGHWTQHWPVTVPTRKFIVVHVTLNFLDPKVLATVTHPLWYRPVANRQFNSNIATLQTIKIPPKFSQLKLFFFHPY